MVVVVVVRWRGRGQRGWRREGSLLRLFSLMIIVRYPTQPSRRFLHGTWGLQSVASGEGALWQGSFRFREDIDGHSSPFRSRSITTPSYRLEGPASPFEVAVSNRAFHGYGGLRGSSALVGLPQKCIKRCFCFSITAAALGWRWLRARRKGRSILCTVRSLFKGAWHPSSELHNLSRLISILIGRCDIFRVFKDSHGYAKGRC